MNYSCRSKNLIAFLVALILCSASSVSFAQPDKPPSLITGECHCDTSAFITECNYTIFSGTPALSHMIFPIPQNCVARFTVSSPTLNFSSPQLFNSNWCGSIFGIKADQEVPEGTFTTITIQYEGICQLGVNTVQAALKSGANCELFPVPGVSDCPDIPCIQWSLVCSELTYEIKKPGTYAGKLGTMTIESNTAVNVSFESFEDLQSLGNATSTITACYATSPIEQTTPPPFLTAADFNNHTILIPEEAGVFQFCIWSKIVVDNSVTACEYGDNATIVLELQNFTTAIDGP